MSQRIVLPHEWEPREYQLSTWQYMRSQRERKRAVFVCHRRGGKDLMAVNVITTAAFERIGSYWHMYPQFKQAKAAIWNGFTSEGEPGNEGVKGTKFLDHIPKPLIDRTYENELRIKFKNGSNYYLVGSDNFDGLVGTNPIGIVFSEYSLMVPGAWHYLSPILEENGGWALFIYTYRGKNHGWWLAQQAKKNPDWHFVEKDITVTKKPNGEPVISEAQIEKIREEGIIPESVIQSEFYNNPDAPLKGAYYEKEMAAVKKAGRITDVPHDPRAPVYTAWDIGFDMTVILFVQIIHNEVRIIDCIYESGLGLPQAIAKMKEKPYENYEKHFAPWDMDTREYASGKSRMDIARGLKVNFSVKPQKPGNAGIADGIDQVRMLLPRVIFDAEKCSLLIEALRQFRSEPEQEKLQYTGEQKASMELLKPNPLHDWASHGDSAMRVLAWNIANMQKQVRQLPDRADDSYHYV